MALCSGCGDGAGDGAPEREVFTVVARDFEWRLATEAPGNDALGAVAAGGHDVEAADRHGADAAVGRGVGVAGGKGAGEGGPALPRERVTRDAISSEGVRLASPGRLGFVVRAQAGDRLRLRFVRAAPAEGEAVPGDDGPGLRLTDAAGRLDAGACSWRVRDDWQEVEFDLSPLAGGEARLALAAGPEPGEVLIGQVLQLRRSSVAHPDVILYVEDALRADHLASYGYEQPTDPHLQRIAAQGLRFSHGFASANWTRPSVSTLLTGLDAGDHGNTADGGRIPEAARTLAEVYSDAGYVTAAFVTNIHAGVWSGLERGFDLHYDMKAFPRSSRDSSLTSAMINAPLLPFLARHRDELLFVYIHSTDPHGPYRSTSEDLFAVMDAGAPRRVPPEVAQEHAARWSEWTLNYDGEIHHNDRSLARLDESLTSLGLMRDTLFVFTADHGEAFLDHGTWGHRRTLYQEELAVPWVLRWPAVLAAERVLEQPVGQLDLPPTLLSLSGIAPPAGWAGRDLSALCREPDAPGSDAAAPRPMLIWGETPEGHAIACVLSPWKLVAVPGADGEPLPVSLYNLRDDPAERQDLLRHSELHPVVEALLGPVRDFMARHARASGDAPASDGLTGLDEDDLDWLREMGYLR